MNFNFQDKEAPKGYFKREDITDELVGYMDSCIMDTRTDLPHIVFDAELLPKELWGKFIGYGNVVIQRKSKGGYLINTPFPFP